MNGIDSVTRDAQNTPIATHKPESKMVYVVTYLSKGKRQFCVGYWSGHARITTKYEAERTMQENEKRGREGIEIGSFKNLGEACEWRNAFNQAVEA